MQKRDKTILGAVIGAVAVIIAAVIGAFGPAWWHSVAAPNAPVVIAGAVVDQASRGIGQATISLAGRTESYVTEDNGNFRIELHGGFVDNQRIRIHVTKDGYQPADQTVTPSAENLIIQLRKL